MVSGIFHYKLLDIIPRARHTIFENLRDGVIVLDLKLRILDLNPAAEKMLGEKTRNLVGKIFNEVLPDEIKFSREEFEHLPSQKEVSIDKGGEIYWWSIRLLPIYDHANLSVGYLVIMQDVTDYKIAERALQKSQKMYSSIINDAIDSLSSGIIILDKDFKIIWVNKAICEFFGVDREDLLGKDKRKIIKEKIKYVFSDPWLFEKTVLKTYENNTYVESFLCHVLSGKNRKERFLIHWSRPITSGLLAGGRVEHYYDITEQKKLEEELRHIQKMEAVGVLAGGLAHDFNNLLTAILGNVELALMLIKKEDPVYKRISNVQKAAMRAADLTRQMLLFSRRQPMKFVPIDLNRIIRELSEMLDRMVGENILLMLDLCPNVWTVKADSGAIEQVIINLVINSKDAMPNGGKIIIKTRNVDIGEDYCRTYSYARPGRFVSLSVENEGVGIAPEIMERIFEPFFTTKHPGRGTGMGLSVVYGIVKQHGGWIEVESEVGKGAKFKLYFPATLTEVEKEVSYPKLESVRGDGEKVLLLEDEESVKEFAEKLLSDSGYIVFSARTIKEGFNLFEEEKGEFDLLICDIVLPDGRGTKFVEKIF